jgi:hypothetical protein
LTWASISTSRRFPAPLHAVQPFDDELADLPVLLRCRAHQRDLRVVDVQRPVAELLRDGVPGAEIDHVDGADRADIGQPRADHRAEPVLRRRKDAAEQQVRHFRGGRVDQARDQS